MEEAGELGVGAAQEHSRSRVESPRARTQRCRDQGDQGPETYPEAQTDGVSGTARERQAETQRHRKKCTERGNKDRYTQGDSDGLTLEDRNKDAQRETQRDHTHTHTRARKLKTDTQLKTQGVPLLVQWLTRCALNEEHPGSIPGQGTRSHMPQLRLRAVI